MRLISRLFIVFAALALIAWGAWTYLLQRGDVQQEMYAKGAEARATAAQPHRADPKAFRATVCSLAPCVLVEAGGLSFLVDAGVGSGEGLASRGLMRSDLDAVMLTSVAADHVEGLADVVAAQKVLGRVEPVPVFGPAGAERVVQGTVALLSAADPAPPSAIPAAGQTVAKPPPLVLGNNDSTAPDGSVLVFDSGVVSVSAFAAPGPPAERVYRFDFGSHSLIVAGCSATAADIIAATRGAAQASIVIAAASPAMLEADRKAAEAAGAKGAARPACLSADAAVAAIKSAKLRGGLLAPLNPAPADAITRRIWAESVTAPEGLTVAAGEPGTALDVTATGLQISREGKPVDAAKPAKTPVIPAKTEAQKQAGP